jgi:hypothetical protein
MKEMSERLARGDRVRVRSLGSEDWSRGVVRLASDTDPQSAIVELENSMPIGGGFYMSFVPLTVEYQRERVTDLLTGTELEIEVAG